MNGVIMASALRGIPHIAAFDQVLAERFDLLSVAAGSTLMDLYDTVDARLLDYLAEEWDLLGWKGWALAETEQQKRDLLKAAYDIKRTMGTPYAIRRAATALGIRGYIRIQEGVGFFLDGEYYLDGSMFLGAGRWATFAVFFNTADNPGIGSDRLNQFKNMIEEYKPVRSRLIKVGTYTL